LAQVSVSLAPATSYHSWAETVPVAAVETDQDGRYALAAIPSGEYTIHAARWETKDGRPDLSANTHSAR